MARDVDTITFTVRIRWWVQPMLFGARVFAFVMQPLMNEDDADRLVGGVSDFIARHGFVLREAKD